MQQVINNRRKLKRTCIVVKEDIANANSCQLDQSRKHKKVKNCWALDGRVFAIIEGTNKTDVKIIIKSTNDLAKL